MDSEQKLNLFSDKFVHVDSPFAEQKYDEKNDSTIFFPMRKGKCNHVPKHDKQRECDGYTLVPFTDSHLTQHLKGQRTYAPYQISPKDATIKWLCFDIDSYNEVEEDAIKEKVREVARKIYATFGPHHCLVEQSGSKGYHVWLFFDEPIHVSQGFALGHKLTQMIPTDKNINIEIYPKQQSAKVLGNTVKLPLGIHQKTKSRCLFVKSSFEPYSNDEQWEALSKVLSVSSEWVTTNIKITQPPKDEEGGGYRKFNTYVPLCLTEILEHGCGEGIRDEAAFRESAYLESKGIPFDLGRSLLETWNTKNSPPLDSDALDLKIEQGYSGNYSWKPCHLSTFDSHCHSACMYFQKKVEKRWYTEHESPIGVISYD